MSQSQGPIVSMTPAGRAFSLGNSYPPHKNISYTMVVATNKTKVSPLPRQHVSMRHTLTFGSEHSGRSTVPAFETTSSQKMHPSRSTSAEHRNRHVEAKHVSFKVDENDNILANIATFESPPEEASSDIYWGETKLADIYLQAKLLAKEFRMCRSDLLDSVRILYGSPDTAKPKTTHDFSANQAMEILALSPARGLEHQVTSMIRKHRQKAIESILTTQDKLKFKDPEQMATILRLRSLQVSRCDRLFALKLAEGDALVAQSANELV